MLFEENDNKNLKDRGSNLSNTGIDSKDYRSFLRKRNCAKAIAEHEHILKVVSTRITSPTTENTDRRVKAILKASLDI